MLTRAPHTTADAADLAIELAEIAARHAECG
jgi:hypothetical protein